MIETEKLAATQQRVFDYMVEFGSITTIQACNDLGETRFSARIFELKKKGVPICIKWEEVKNRYNETRRVKRYYIA